MRDTFVTYLLCLSALAGCLSAFTSCSDDGHLSVGEPAGEETTIGCRVADFVVSSNRVTRAAADAIGTDSEQAIHTLDFLVFDDETCILHLNSQKNRAENHPFVSDTDGDANWVVTGLLPKSLLSDAAYTHVLVANCPDGQLPETVTLSGLKKLFLNNTDFNPYAEQTAGIPMIQILEPATGTRTEFDGTTLTFGALERVTAKVQVVAEEVSGTPCIISSYKLINYLDDGYLYNDDATQDYAFDKRYNDALVRAFQNGFADGKVSLTGFNEWGTCPTMQGENGFALYCYPNYWFDNEDYDEKKEGMHKFQPILEERQTYLLVKARYVNQATGVLSNKEYYYKIPVNSRLPEWNDAYTNGDIVSDKICDALIDAVYEGYVDGQTFDSYTDDQKAALYATMQNELQNALYPVYSKSDGTTMTDAEKETVNEQVLKAILTKLETVAKEGSVSDDDKKNTLRPAIREAIMYERVRAEAETMCRLQRNHHYIIYTSFDHAGGETADEAFYLATEPFFDVVLRPEF